MLNCAVWLRNIKYCIKEVIQTKRYLRTGLLGKYLGPNLLIKCGNICMIHNTFLVLHVSRYIQRILKNHLREGYEVIVNIIFNALFVLVWFTSCSAETNRTPFNFSEGESELVSGFNVEYRRGGFA